MIKFKTEIVPFTALKEGDLIGMSWGFSVLVSVEEQADGKMTLHFARQPSVTFDPSNWPEIAVGYSDKYQAAYPNEVFKR